MSVPKPFEISRILNGILGLGLMIMLAGLAGLAATAISGSGESAEVADGRVAPIPGEGLRPTYIGGKYGYVNGAGAIVIAPRFDGADTFSEGLALVLEKGRFGYIDAHGSFAIPAVFRHARPFQDGFASVRMGSDWLVIDRDGRSIASRDDSDR